MMTIRCAHINDKLNLISCDQSEALALTRNPESKVWIDVQGAEFSQLEALLDELAIKGLTKRLCMDGRGRPGFYPLNSFIFMVIPVQGANEAMNEVEYVSVLCRQNLLLTMRNLRESPLQNITTLHESADWLSDASIPGLYCSILLVLTLESTQKLSELRDIVTTLENRMDRDPDLVDLNEISNHRSRLLAMETIINGQLPSVQALTATDKSFFRLETSREYLVSAMANLQAADRTLQWLQGRIDIIRSNYEMRSQDKTNRRLSRLTILSTIFMPITFLTGIWGMNFEQMPLLRQSYGYTTVMGSMLLIGVSMFFYFRWKGWFER